MIESTENLVKLGFTATEAKVYFKVVQEEQLKVTELARATRITRTQLYPLLKRMVRKGYIEEVPSKPVSYKAVPPESLVSVLEEEKKNQFSLLLSLKNNLEQLMPVQTVTAPPYDISIIKGEKNIVSKLLKLTNAAEKEIIKTSAFERALEDKNRELSKATKQKVREGVKVVVHSSIKPENLSKIAKIRGKFNGAVFGGLIREEPYSTFIFDREKLLLVFFNYQKECYDTALYIENKYLAESFALKNVAPIESCPLTGELYLSAYGGERSFLLPANSLNTLSKRQQYDLGYSIGYALGTKNIKEKGNRNIGANYVLTTLSTLLSVCGWGKISFDKSKQGQLNLVIENATVGCRLIKGILAGFLSVVGKYAVTETKCVLKKNEFCELTVKAEN